MLTLVGSTAIPCLIAGPFRSPLGPHRLSVAANTRSPSGDDLRNYKLEHLDRYAQVRIQIDRASRAISA